MRKAEELVKKCPVKVFDIEDIGKATIFNTSRVLPSPQLQSGALPPEVLFTETANILEDKYERVITELPLVQNGIWDWNEYIILKASI